MNDHATHYCMWLCYRARIVRWAFRWWRSQHYRRDPMIAIRSHMAYFGFPLDHLTDDDIIQGAREFGAIVAECGITAQEAADAFGTIAREDG